MFLTLWSNNSELLNVQMSILQRFVCVSLLFTILMFEKMIFHSFRAHRSQLRFRSTLNRPHTRLLFFNPLRFTLERVDFGQQLVVCTLRVIVDDDHVKEVPPSALHVSSRRDDLFQFFFLLNERNH